METGNVTNGALRNLINMTNARDNHETGCNRDQELSEKGRTFEHHVLDAVGHFGPYQRWVFAILTMTDIPAGMCMLYFIFSNANPGTRCRLFEGNKTYENNFSTGGDIACVVNGSKCVQFEYQSEYNSIITEVGSLLYRWYGRHVFLNFSAA
jgi:hypothetical protein